MQPILNLKTLNEISLTRKLMSVRFPKYKWKPAQIKTLLRDFDRKCSASGKLEKNNYVIIGEMEGRFMDITFDLVDAFNHLSLRKLEEKKKITMLEVQLGLKIINMIGKPLWKKMKILASSVKVQVDPQAFVHLGKPFRVGQPNGPAPSTENNI